MDLSSPAPAAAAPRAVHPLTHHLYTQQPRFSHPAPQILWLCTSDPVHLGFPCTPDSLHTKQPCTLDP